MFFGGNAISWKSKKSNTVATSSTTAELEALYHASSEVIWIRRLLADLGFRQDQPTVIYQDNDAGIKVVNGDKNFNRTKHEMVKIAFLREQVQAGEIALKRKPTGEMVADMMTKSLGKSLFQKHRQFCGVEEKNTTFEDAE